MSTANVKYRKVVLWCIWHLAAAKTNSKFVKVKKSLKKKSINIQSVLQFTCNCWTSTELRKEQVVSEGDSVQYVHPKEWKNCLRIIPLYSNNIIANVLKYYRLLLHYYMLFIIVVGLMTSSLKHCPLYNLVSWTEMTGLVLPLTMTEEPYCFFMYYSWMRPSCHSNPDKRKAEVQCGCNTPR